MSSDLSLLVDADCHDDGRVPNGLHGVLVHTWNMCVSDGTSSIDLKMRDHAAGVTDLVRADWSHELMTAFFN